MLESKLDDFKLTHTLPWVEQFLITSALPAVDPEDDLKREEAMYALFVPLFSCT